MRKTILFLIIFIWSCSENIPKPLGYNRIDKPEYHYKTFESQSFAFQYPDISTIERLNNNSKDNNLWFNIHYPDYNATIYCSYIKINPTTLNKALEDSYQLAYSHSLQANDIEQRLYTNPTENISGILYRINGNVATPLQFYVTDSVNHFFRGSLYFDQKVNEDSVTPIINFIREDIEQLMSTFKHKKLSSINSPIK